MATYLTQTVLTELKAILEADKLKPSVTINELIPLATASKDISVDIALQSVLLEPYKASSSRDGYNRTFLINLYCSVDCGKDNLRIFDVVDSLESAVLKDSAIWNVVTNRDIVTITYDNAQHAPYRSATILVEALIRLECTE